MKIDYSIKRANLFIICFINSSWSDKTSNLWSVTYIYIYLYIYDNASISLNKIQLNNESARIYNFILDKDKSVLNHQCSKYIHKHFNNSNNEVYDSVPGVGFSISDCLQIIPAIRSISNAALQLETQLFVLSRCAVVAVISQHVRNSKETCWKLSKEFLSL